MNHQYAKVIADSVSEKGDRIITLEVNFWRGILSEANTHRVLSKNTSSTRAIPVLTALKQLSEMNFLPEFTINRPGMMSNEVMTGWKASVARGVWTVARYAATACSWGLCKLGVSKQYAGRLVEPFQYVKAVWTGTDWKNFLHLRDHEAAQPEIRDLAQKIRRAIQDSVPVKLKEGEWHTPYYVNGCWIPSKPGSGIDANGVQLNEALMISVSCCAQVSYRKNDDSLVKAASIMTRLVPNDGSPVHASPLEHQATPLICPDDPGFTHVKKGGVSYSGNLRGWSQHRQRIPNHYKPG